MYKTLDLFAGAGGLSYGFQQTGKFQTVAAAEINKNAMNTFRRNLAPDSQNFLPIENVVGYKFKELNEKMNGIDIIIGGPPCQGFSNANRQKNHLISMNNGLVKEYFRAVKEIQPIAFVMENVNSLRSEVHRFYDSSTDNRKIEELIENGATLPKRLDTISIGNTLEDIDLFELSNNPALLNDILLPHALYKLLRILNKHQKKPEKLTAYLLKQTRPIQSQIDKYIGSIAAPTTAQENILEKLRNIRLSLSTELQSIPKQDLSYIVSLQATLITISEIHENHLMGTFIVRNDILEYDVNSYSVIDYINAILGKDYVQVGGTLNAEWFGVPQERRRYIILGIRKDIALQTTVALPQEPEEYSVVTIGEAISDLASYPVSRTREYPHATYATDDTLSDYAKKMRANSTSVKNHITTDTRPTAMTRFKSISQGNNFHSLSPELKSTYSDPQRTQKTIYLRLDPEKPSGTVVNVRKSMWIHPTLDRAITVREAARLQSFPDDFEFLGPKDSQYQQVGNAVPPLLANAIAKKLLSILNPT